MFGDGDLGVFFADMGRTVVAGSQTTLAIFDSPGDGIDLHSLAPVSGVDYSIEYPSTSLSQMAVRQQITVDGIPFQVTSIDPVGDGLVSRAKLKFLGSSSGPAGATPTIVPPYGRKQFAETPDGVRTVFTLPYKASASSIQVLEDGLTLTDPDDYTLSSNGLQVIFVTAPRAGGLISALY